MYMYNQIMSASFTLSSMAFESLIVMPCLSLLKSREINRKERQEAC